MKLVLCMIAVTILSVLTPALDDNCPPGCQKQLDELKNKVSLLQDRTPIFQGWRPASADDPSKKFNLPFTPDLAVVTLFQWDWHRPDRPIYSFKPMPSVIVAKDSTAVLEVPKQQEEAVKGVKYIVDAPCQVFVTLSGKTLSYKTACAGELSSPAFNVVFMFTTSSQP